MRSTMTSWRTGLLRSQKGKSRVLDPVSCERFTSTTTAPVTATLAARVTANVGLLVALTLFALPTQAHGQTLPSSQLAPLQAKQVNAPADDILQGTVRLPDPSSAARVSKSALLPVVFDSSGRWQMAIPAEGFGELSFVPLSAEADQWQITLAEPGELPRTLSSWGDSARALSTSGPLGLLPGAAATRWDVSTDRMGSWTITIQHRAGAPDGLLLVGGGGAARLVSHTTSWRLTSDRSIGIVAYSGESASSSNASTRGGQLTEVSATVSVAGSKMPWPVADDGLHGDGAANDGVFGLVLPPLPAGTAHVSLVARGMGHDGLPFLRTAEHLLAVSDPALRLTGEVTTRVESDDRLAFDIGANLLGLPKTVQVSAEVWAEHAVAWMSTMATPAADGTLTLSLHGAWLARAGAPQNLVLRHLRVQDRDTHAVLDELPDTALFVEELPSAALLPPSAKTTSDMLMGVPMVALSATTISPSGSSRATLRTGLRPPKATGVTAPSGPIGPLNPPERGLLLVHGYCADLAWPPSHFSGQTLTLDDQNANRSHDEFAQLIAALGSGFDSFGVVAHSQGGPASLHLLTYYTSGLDFAIGDRRIQSLGSPYLGTPLASSLAGIGQVFGVGCGPNDDLSESGAALWAAGIPTWARAEVTSYTTSFSGFWCEFVTNLVLDNPEDGVTELDKAILSGANVMPHFVGQCHTVGMSNPAQYLDSARNAVMDAAAAR
ncbi:MAG: hypothetical protein ACI9EF_002272 [Pseudohongiellaceae bacterium]|jgi:hypothetical protein